jgi:hypothetical protein
MNKKKAIAIISKSSSITLYQNIDGSSWLGNYAAFYNMGKFPHCESEEEIANVLGFTDKQADACTFAITNNSFPIREAEMKHAGLLTPIDFQVVGNGKSAAFFFNSGTNRAIAVNGAFLKPFDVDAIYNEYESTDGSRVVAVSYGFIRVGFILELRQEKGIVNKYLKVFNALIEDSEVSDDVQL